MRAFEQHPWRGALAEPAGRVSDPSLQGLRPFSLWDRRAFRQHVFGAACEIGLLERVARPGDGAAPEQRKQTEPRACGSVARLRPRPGHSRPLAQRS